MQDQRKTKAQLIDELKEIRARLAEIETKLSVSQTKTDTLYRHVVDLSPDPFAVLQDGIMKFASPSFTAVFGYTQEEIARGMSMTSFVSEKDKAVLIQRVNDRLAGKDISNHFQIDVVAKDGSIVPCETAAALIDFEGRPADLILARDITDRIRAEQHTRFLSLVTEQISDSIIATDTNHKIIYVNRAFSNQFGYSPEEVLGRTPDIFNADPNADRIQADIYKTVSAGGTYTGSSLNRKKDGSTFVCEYGVFQLVNEDGSVFAYASIGRDVTDRVNMETELRSARIDLETKVAQRTAELKSVNQQMCKEIAERGRTMEVLRENEEYIRAILESTDDGILVVDTKNKVTHTNARFVEMWKIPPELIKNRDDNKLLDYVVDQLEHPEVFLDTVRCLYATKDTSFDTIKFKDGRVIERYTTPLIKDNAIDGRVWSFRDVTDMYRAHEEAYKFKMVSDRANYGIAMVALDGTLIYLNDTFADMYGYDRHDLLGDSLRNLHKGDQLMQLKRLTRLVINKGGFEAEELWRTRKDGTECPALLTGTIIRDDQGSPLFFSLTAIDTTELKRAQDERAAFESELQKAQRMESLGRMAAAVAHDFNNILTLIMGYVDIAATALSQDAETREYIERIFSAGHQARDIIDQILAFAREEASDDTPVLVHLVVKEVLALLEPAIPPTVTVRRHIDSAAGSVRIDAMQIHRVVANLCSNALYAMKQDGGVLELRVERADVDPETARSVQNLHAGPYVRVTISDTGTGIDPDIMDRVFEPFFSTKPPSDGMGLGLSTVSGIVTTHGGAIELKSQTEEGTTAAVYLPRAGDTLTIEPKSPPGPLPTGTEQILLIDDEPNVLKMISIILDKLGYTVISNTSESESLDVFRTNSTDIDLVIVDQVMPLIRGTDLAKRFINMRPDIPVVLMTGISNAIDHDTMKAVGLRGYIRKPVTARSIGNAVRHVLDGHTYFET